MRPNMMGGSDLRVSQLIPSKNPLRRIFKGLTIPHSTPQGHNSMSPTSSTFATDSLPSYTKKPGKEPGSLPASRLTILPREEEGKEELPPYTCSLHKEGVFGRKMEMRSPFERSRIRRWKRCYLILHGTKLDVHKPKRTSKSALNPESPRPKGWKPGKLLASYTLQLAEVGAAPDYFQRQYTIRLRVQAEQFILSCPNLEVFLDWLEALSAAIDLAPSLEERSLPQHRTLPRSRRRRAGELQQQEQQWPSTRQADQESISSHRDVAAAVMMDAPSTLQPNGKWAPRGAVTREANMRYARRCTVALLVNAPRRSNYVVVGGCRYKINWEKRKLVQDDGGREGVEVATGKGMDVTADGLPTPSNLPGYAESTGNGTRWQQNSAVVNDPWRARAVEDRTLYNWWWVVGGI